MGSDKTNMRRRPNQANRDTNKNNSKSKNDSSPNMKGSGITGKVIFAILVTVISVVAVVVYQYGAEKAFIGIFKKSEEARGPSVEPPAKKLTPSDSASGSARNSPESAPTIPSPHQSTSSKADFTNKYDEKIQSLLDEADNMLNKGKIQTAVKKYNEILKKYSKSPRAHYGLANALSKDAESQRSNQILEKSIEEYKSVVGLPNVPMALLREAINTAVDKMHFRGWAGKAAKFMKDVTVQYPEDVGFQNKLGVCYLMTGQGEPARKTFKAVLDKDKTNGFAKVHYGFILKTTDNDCPGSIPYLQGGIDSKEPGTNDGRFFFHLGDALNRVGKVDESYKVYKQGADQGHFLSMYQRSLYNVDSLTGRPWWTPHQTTYQKYLKLLEDNWQTIREEGLAQLDATQSGFRAEDENLRERGDWKQFTLWQRGKKHEANCQKAPKTCNLIEQIPPAKGCTRGQVKYSVMQPGVHVWPHCGPTNCRIRAHLGLVVPRGPRIRVADKMGEWKEGKFIIFDDSFEHEVWHDGDSFRLVLIVDFWHPELSEQQRRTLSPI